MEDDVEMKKIEFYFPLLLIELPTINLTPKIYQKGENELAKIKIPKFVLRAGKVLLIGLVKSLFKGKRKNEKNRN